MNWSKCCNFEDKIDQIKCWNLSPKCKIIKISKWCNLNEKVGIDYQSKCWNLRTKFWSVELSVPNDKLIRMLKFEWKILNW